MNLPSIISKAWLAEQFGRPFPWIRRHLLTDEVVTQELGFDLDTFKSWRDFPPKQGAKLKNWLISQNLI